MKRLLYGVPLLLLACAASLAAKDRDTTPGAIGVSSRTAPGDSVWFFAEWTAPTLGPRQLPIESYVVEWLNGGVPQITHSTPGLRDSARVARPPLGETLGPLAVRVRSRDTGGALSDWSTSSEFTLTTVPDPPSAPGPVQVDTAGVQIARLIVRPESIELTELGQEAQLCALAEFVDGTWAIEPYTMYCQEQLDLVRGTATGPLAVRLAE
jgi:hypothetical protein